MALLVQKVLIGRRPARAGRYRIAIQFLLLLVTPTMLETGVLRDVARVGLEGGIAPETAVVEASENSHEDVLHEVLVQAVVLGMEVPDDPLDRVTDLSHARRVARHESQDDLLIDRARGHAPGLYGG